MTVKITGEFDSWVRGFARLASSTEPWRDDWGAAVEFLFDRSQDYVHVDTGFLKSTGHYDVQADGASLVGEVAYDAEYAQYEHDRGGEHAFLLLAWTDAEDQFAGALGDSWDKVWEDS